jgi:hypothetical protein
MFAEMKNKKLNFKLFTVTFTKTARGASSPEKPARVVQLPKSKTIPSIKFKQENFNFSQLFVSTFF